MIIASARTLREDGMEGREQFPYPVKLIYRECAKKHDRLKLLFILALNGQLGDWYTLGACMCLFEWKGPIYLRFFGIKQQFFKDFIRPELIL
jgi:hypothetical protein